MVQLPETVQDMMAGLPAMFRAEKAVGVNARVQFNLSGEEGGTWTVVIAEGQCSVREGVEGTPNATLGASAADYLAIVRGELDPMKAFMSGRLSAKGDMGLMMRFMQFFERPK